MKIIFAITMAVWFAQIAAAQNSPAGRSAAATPAQLDQPGTPLKSEPPGTTLKSEPPGAPVQSEAAGTLPKPEPPGTTLKPEPHGTPDHPAPTGTLAWPEQKMALSKLREKHSDSVTDLKNKQVEEIKTLRESLKGKPQTGIRKAVKIKKAEQNAALKALHDSNRAEIVQFRKDRPQPIKQGEDNTQK